MEGWTSKREIPKRSYFALILLYLTTKISEHSTLEDLDLGMSTEISAALSPVIEGFFHQLLQDFVKITNLTKAWIQTTNFTGTSKPWRKCQVAQYT